MQENFIPSLFKNGFLNEKKVDSKSVYHLSTPCRFSVKDVVVNSLKLNYIPDEEIGGVLWANPTLLKNERVYVIDKVSYVRNAIEDVSRTDTRNKRNAYLPDSKQLNEAFDQIFECGYLPIKFHTHPTSANNFMEQIMLQELQTETSKQDQKESENCHSVGDYRLLMPRALIVGNGAIGNNIFIGLYNGSIAPVEFETSKKKVQQENFQIAADKIASISLTDEQKLAFAILALVAIIIIVRYSKNTLPLILGLAALLPGAMTNTSAVQTPNYFNKLSSGSAEIYIPEK